MTKKILILAANPKDTPRLRLDQEVREIDNGLQRARRRDEFVMKQKWATRPVDVRRAMLDSKPNIVHFCGHGEGEEGIAFEDETGCTKLVSAEVLADFFELFADKVECVVLNACYSEVQAKAIAQHIDYVIGMKKDITDTVAIEFAVAFYDTLGAGESIEFAYRLACNAIQWAGVPEHSTPILKSKTHSSKRADEETRKHLLSGNKGIPAELVTIIKTGECVPFVGAGFSVAAGLPSTQEILEILCSRMNYDLSGNEIFEKVAELYANIKGQVELRKTLASLLGNDKIQLSKGHIVFGELIRRGYFKTIITTNYDNVIESSIERAPRLRRIMTDSPFPFIDSDEIGLIKYRGSIDRESTMVISESDYLRSNDARQRMYDHLKDVFRLKNLLMIGLSMQDFDFKFFFHALGYSSNSFVRRAYLVHPKSDKPNWEIQKHFYWASKNIEIVEKTIDEFFGDLKSALPLKEVT
jgi:hypothetical protein